MISQTQSALPYRSLIEAEIKQLQQQGCTANDWTEILIHPETQLNFIHHVHFHGWNKIGLLESEHHLPGGISFHSGIYNATLYQTIIGNNVLILNNSGYISNYDIEDNCILIDTGTISTEDLTSFGQGTEIAVLNETGGREIIIHDKLSSHEAYLQAMYRHDSALIERLRSMASEYVKGKIRNRGTIENHSTIIRCDKLKNVYIQAYSHLEGCKHLENGTICSSQTSPAFIGDNVIGKDFIIQDGCKISEGCQITRCYIGQSSIVGHGYSASDCYIGCNCQLENGEACAIFAGPYTVSHHKSTLLIGGFFSFMNAGSGTNQSNHMYKLGPSHQGILERGCKTASGSYMLWPLRAGAFSMIMGHFTQHADTQDFPFSYLIEKQGTHYLIPAIALRNVGTARDISKWPARDQRHPQSRMLDQLIFEAYSPYIMEKVLCGTRILKTLAAQAPDNSEMIEYHSVNIKVSAIQKGMALYQMITDLFIGEQLIRKFKQTNAISGHEMLAQIRPQHADIRKWCDVGGLIAPYTVITDLTSRIKQHDIQTLDDLGTEWEKMKSSYEDWTWQWTWSIMEELYPETATSWHSETVTAILKRYQDAVTSQTNAIVQDATKEFSPESRIGFGIDDAPDHTDEDFIHVRGCIDKNSFINGLKTECAEKLETARHWLNFIMNTP